MTHVILFNIVLLAACAYAFVAGGAPERWTAIVFLGGAIATFLLPFRHHQSYHTVHLLVLAVDSAVLLGLIGIALRADRFWPMYVSALHLITIAIHGVKAFQPSLVPWMYAGASGKIAYPMLVLLATGAWRHRHRLARFGSDRDWSPLRRPESDLS
ncbi:hypothetical protein NF700_15060 [Sphingomonadaceae bacterium OTU29MARTA1]|uniref:hypothetical protein n=1 Tax=Sphingomonas sp. Leaf37 TaxID=2876552 RepID=UPI001E46BF05|nr:hypothetical protein [Sphingomonas sp. Leaf37]USU04732.1 hypothetical protein NF699_17095 [Sphingomonadaceae bacterium OTU29LAMAA1]USU08374.1 hypothetical protein NF700_15060 [Sphingomonadaceae bacterium OTU29MARTA1]USU11850.1 hypothetical protein NF701_15130 [Sphingomonadaceae bacterium OTU29THOMA1]